MSKIFLTSNILARALARVQANDPRWQTLQSLCATRSDWSVRPVAYACAYVLTGNTAYADSAIQLASVFVGQGVGAVQDDSGFPCRQVLPEVALTLNWCGDRLTAAQRATWADVLEAQARWVWPETNPSRQGAWGVGWVTTNYFHGFQMTLLAGCALQQEGRSFGQTLIDQALARHRTKVMPRMQPGGEWEGGYPEEGLSYGVGGSWQYMHEALAAYISIGGSLSSILPATWTPAIFRLLTALTLPDTRHLYPGGDQALVSDAPVSDYTMAALLPLLPYTSIEDQGMARFWIDQIYANRHRVSSVAWQQLLFYPDVPAIDYRQRLGTFYSMPGVGVVSSRSSWASDAVQVVTVGGAVRDDDHDDDTGTFYIARGADVLAGFQKIWNPSGIEHKIGALNGVRIGGKDQPGKQEDTHVLFSVDTVETTSWAADLTGAYPDDLNEHRREVLFLKPNIVIVFDRVNTRVAATAKEWLLQTKNAPTFGSGTYRVTNGGSTLFGTSVMPAGAAITQDKPSASYRLHITAPGGILQHFLQVLEATPSSQGFATPVTLAGNTLRIGSRTVAVNLTATGTTPALTLSGGTTPPPPQETLAVSITTFAPTPGGAAFAGTVADTAPLPAGSTLTVTVQKPGGQPVTTTATIGETTPPPQLPPAVLLTDSFDGPGTVPGPLWVAGTVVSGHPPNSVVGVMQGGGALTITPRPNLAAAAYNGILSRQPVVLTGAQATLEVLEATKGTANTQFGVIRDTENYLLMETEGGLLYAAVEVDGSREQVAVSYSAVAHRFWRIRHNAVDDEIVWEVSANGTSWTTLHSAERLFPITALTVELASGTWERVPAPGKSVFASVVVERVR